MKLFKFLRKGERCAGCGGLITADEVRVRDVEPHSGRLQPYHQRHAPSARRKP